MINAVGISTEVCSVFPTGPKMVGAVEVPTEVCSLFPTGSKMGDAMGISTEVCSTFPPGSEKRLMQWGSPLKFALCFPRDRNNSQCSMGIYTGEERQKDTVWYCEYRGTSRAGARGPRKGGE